MEKRERNYPLNERGREGPELNKINTMEEKGNLSERSLMRTKWLLQIKSACVHAYRRYSSDADRSGASNFTQLINVFTNSL